MWDPYAEFQSATLPNGLTVYAAHWPGRPWEAVGIVVYSGAKHDPEGLEGLAHFLEHLLSENTKMPENEIEKFFEDQGGAVSFGETDYTDMCFRFFIPFDKEILGKSFSIFGHMLLHAKIEKSIKGERRVVIGEFNKEFPTVLDQELKARERKALYGGTWLSRFVDIRGTSDSVQCITKEDLQVFYDTHYTPKNMSVVAVGGFTLKELVDALSESPFATKKKGTRTKVPRPAATVMPPSETRYVFEASKDPSRATPRKTALYRSVAKLPGNANRHALVIMSEMLDATLSEEVRVRRGWTYSIGSDWENFQRFKEFYINCESLSLKALDEIDEVVEECISSLANRKDLFERAKRRLIATSFMKDTNCREIRNDVMMDLAVRQRITTLREFIEKTNQITMRDIRKLLKWLRPERRWTLIVRP